MNNDNNTRNIQGLPDEVGITALCTFDQTVVASGGRIEPMPDGFYLHREGKRSRKFDTAASAVRVLRRLSS